MKKKNYINLAIKAANTQISELKRLKEFLIVLSLKQLILF